MTFSATADAVVKRDSPTTNFRTATGLKADNSPVEQIFLKFTVTGTAGSTVTGAKLRLFVTDPSPSGGQFRRVLSNTWSENTITFNNAPVAETPIVASRGAVADNTFVEFDLFSVIKRDGTYSFRISSTWCHLRLQGDIVIHPTAPIDRHHQYDAAAASPSAPTAPRRQPVRDGDRPAGEVRPRHVGDL